MRRGVATVTISVFAVPMISSAGLDANHLNHDALTGG